MDAREAPSDALDRVELRPAGAASALEPGDHHERSVEVVANADRVLHLDRAGPLRIDVDVLVDRPRGGWGCELRHAVPRLEGRGLVRDRVDARIDDDPEEDDSDHGGVRTRRAAHALAVRLLVHLRDSGETRRARPAADR